MGLVKPNTLSHDSKNVTVIVRNNGSIFFVFYAENDNKEEENYGR